MMVIIKNSLNRSLLKLIYLLPKAYISNDGYFENFIILLDNCDNDFGKKFHIAR